MKLLKSIVSFFFVAAAVSCSHEEYQWESGSQSAEFGELSLKSVAGILARLPLGGEQLREVHDAVSSSSGNGYDEEYMMSDLFSAPGQGVGSPSTKAGSKYSAPLRDLISEYVNERFATKAGGSEAAKDFLERLSNSDMQIYWPASEDWDGSQYPIITFDPGFGAESNFGYEISVGPDGVTVLDSVYVDENVAMSRPVWVVNRNDDSAFTPLEMFAGPGTKASGRRLVMKSFTMLRNYDSWFGGGSEFFVKIGAVNGFKATKDEDLKLYTPSVTDFMVVVKRKDLGVELPYDALLLSDFTSQMEKIAFLLTEDDGGVTTSWKCSAVVKYNSKQYGFDMEIPYKDKDDIVWRGQLSSDFFQSEDVVSGRFGDVLVSFALE